VPFLIPAVLYTYRVPWPRIRGWQQLLRGWECKWVDKTENPKRECRTRAQEDLIEVQKHKDMALFILGLVIIIIVSYTW